MSHELLTRIGRYSTPTVINALRRMTADQDELLPFDRGTVHCITSALGTSIGYAVTARVVSGFSYLDLTRPPDPALRLALYEHVQSQPEPRFLVVEYQGAASPTACYLGEVHANVFRSLGCTAALTNGPVRDIPEMEALGFQTFAGGISVGGDRLQLVGIGEDVHVAGKRVSPGDLLFGDLHGLLRIPARLAPRIPEVAAAVENYEKRIIAACQSKHATPASISAAWNDE
jgi:regulator of RNase E activity RraA